VHALVAPLHRVSGSHAPLTAAAAARAAALVAAVVAALVAAVPGLAPEAANAAALGPGCHSQWPVVAHYAGERPAPAPTPLPVACATETGYATSETTLAVTPSGTLIFSPAETENSVARSLDAGASWSLAYPANEQYTSLWNTVDPRVIVDRRTGRVFWVHATGDLRTTPGVTENSPLPNAIQTIVAYAHGFQVYSSSNDGRDFSTADYSHENMGDWESIFVGPAPPASSGGPRPHGYPDVVYVCANSPFEVSGPGRQCYRSLDGGATFSSAGFVFPSPSSPPDGCPALAANGGIVDNEGTTYQPLSCEMGAYVAASADEGATYTWHAVKDAPPANGVSGSLQLAIDDADNLYGMWTSNDHLYLTVSRDHAQSWSSPLDVTAPGLHTITRPAFAAGPSGRVAITYYASRDPSAQALSAYITETTDALQARPLYVTGVLNDPANPIYVDQGLRGTTPRADFIGGAYDAAGTFWAGVVKQIGTPDANGFIATTGYVGRLALPGAPAPAATNSAGTVGCRASSRVRLTLTRSHGERIVRAVVSINRRRILTRRGRDLRQLSFSRPSTGRLAIQIVTLDSRGHARLTRRVIAPARCR
jgi:hypothetical protein